MRRLAITIFIVVILSLTTFAQEPCKEYGPVGSVISLCPPAGSKTIKDGPGPHSAFNKGTKDEVQYLLGIVEMPRHESVAEFGYWTISMTYSNPQFSNAVLLEIGDFPSANGVRGLRLVFAGESVMIRGSTKKDKVRQIHYIYPAPKGVIVTFSATFVASDSNAQSLTDAAMKTVKIKK